MMLSTLELSPRSFIWEATPTGVSRDAQKIGRLVKIASAYGVEYKRRTSQDIAMNRLGDFLKNLKEDNFASELNPSAIKEVERALNNLPEDIPAPTLMDEGNGFVALEWYKNPKNIFVISFNGTKTLEYASLFGRRSELRGQLEFVDEIPTLLMDQLRKFTQVKV